MRGGDGRPGPQGPQQAPVHPAGAEGRPPREERAQGQSLPAAGGAGLLQKVLTGTRFTRGDTFSAKLLIIVDNYDGLFFAVMRQKMRLLLPLLLPHLN